MRNSKVKVVALFFVWCLFACNSSEKSREVSDSALMAPVDTLGKDTARQNLVGDSITTANIDTAQKTQ